MRAADAWRLREQVRDHRLAPRRLRHCGRTNYRKLVTLQIGGGAAWWNGVVRCRARTCPVCWVARRARAAQEIAHVAKSWRALHPDSPHYFATLTVRHSVADDFSLAREVRACWRVLLQRRKWAKLWAEHGAQWIAAEEVTIGEHGPHPHMHILLLTKSHGLPCYLETANDLFEAWAAIVEQRLGALHTPDGEHGVDLRPCKISDYLTKLGFELADPNVIKGRAPLRLLADGALEPYMQLQDARKRARDITYSRGLKQIREAMPKPALDAVEVLALSGSKWGLLSSLGAGLAPLEVVQAARTPAAALEVLQRYLGPLAGDCELAGAYPDAAE